MHEIYYEFTKNHWNIIKTKYIYNETERSEREHADKQQQQYKKIPIEINK